MPGGGRPVPGTLGHLLHRRRHWQRPHGLRRQAAHHGAVEGGGLVVGAAAGRHHLHGGDAAQHGAAPADLRMVGRLGLAGQGGGMGRGRAHARRAGCRAPGKGRRRLQGRRRADALDVQGDARDRGAAQAAGQHAGVAGAGAGGVPGGAHRLPAGGVRRGEATGTRGGAAAVDSPHPGTVRSAGCAAGDEVV